MSSTELPRELLDLILDQIPRNQPGRQALGSCLLVSREFCQQSRKRLFRQLEVEPDHDKNLTALRKLLEHHERGHGDITTNNNTPSLINYVKSLKITWPLWSVFQPGSLRMLPSGHYGYSVYAEEVGAILAMVAKHQVLQSLTMSFMFRFPIHFSSLESEYPIFQSIQKILDSPALEHLALAGLLSIPHDAFDIRKIKDLTLLNASIFYIPHPGNMVTVGQEPRPKSHLRSFTYDFQDPLPFPWLNSPSPFSHLSTMTAKLDTTRSPTQFNSLLMLSAGNLRTLSIIFESGSIEGGFDLSPHSLQHLTALCALKFTISSFPRNDWEVTVTNLPDGTTFDIHTRQKYLLGSTRDVVKSLNTLNLEKVADTLRTIEVDLRVKASCHLGVEFGRENDWHELGDTLTHSRFGFVERIEVFLVVELGTTEERESLDVDSPFLKEFPGLWRERYPSIPITAVEVEMWNE